MKDKDDDVLGLNSWFDDFDSYLNEENEKICECGSEKSGIPGHSYWCPKYKKKEQ